MAQQRPAEPERLGRSRLDRPPLDWVVGTDAVLHRLEQGPGLGGPLRLSPAAACCRTSGCRRRCRRSPPPLSDSGMAGLYDNGSPVGAAGADGVGRLVGADLMRILSHGVDRLLNVLVMTDDDVERHNRVTLSATMPPDEHGPVPRVEIRQRAALDADAGQPRVPGRRGRAAAAARRARPRSTASTCRRSSSTSTRRCAWASTTPDSVLDANAEARCGQAAVHRRQLGARQRARRPQPDADHPGARHAHGREDLPALLRGIALGAAASPRSSRPRRRSPEPSSSAGSDELREAHSSLAQLSRRPPAQGYRHR